VESGSSDSDAVEPTLCGLYEIVYEEIDVGQRWANRAQPLGLEIGPAPRALEELARRQGLPEDAEVESRWMILALH